VDKCSWDAERWAGYWGRPVGGATAKLLNRKWREGLNLIRDMPAMTIFGRADEWDVCCVLDACRYDTFGEQNTLLGRLELAVSPGFNTRSWINANFTESHSDTILVTSTSWYAKALGKKADGLFFAVDHLWKHGWSNKWRTVLPRTVTGAAIQWRARYPGKKLLLHYMQPHFPNIRPYMAASGLKLGRTDWEQYMAGSVFLGDMKGMYEQNLRIVLRAVSRLREKVGGRVVITADHGEGFGECGVAWSHRGEEMPWLVRIPWFVME